MAVLQEDLFVALSRAACAPNLACLSGSCQVPQHCMCLSTDRCQLENTMHVSSAILMWRLSGSFLPCKRQPEHPPPSLLILLCTTPTVPCHCRWC